MTTAGAQGEQNTQWKPSELSKSFQVLVMVQEKEGAGGRGGGTPRTAHIQADPLCFGFLVPQMQTSLVLFGLSHVVMARLSAGYLFIGEHLEEGNTLSK